jgi:Bacterial Ig domain
MQPTLRHFLTLMFFLAVSAVLFSGCGSSDNFVFTNTQNPVTPPVVLPPTANNDTILTIGNSTLNQAAVNGVLLNDTLNGATISAFDATSSQGGAVVLADDGGFTYTAPFGFQGSDTFTYTLTNSAGDSTATVTLNVDSLAFYVDNTVAPGGNGSQSSPFNNLADALNMAGNGDTVFVFRGDGNSINGAGPITLPPGVKLIGQGSGLIVAQTIEPAGLAPTITGPIVIGGNNTISGFIIDGDGNDSIQANDVSGLVVSKNTFLANTRPHMDLVNLGGTVLVTENTLGSTTQDESFIDLLNVDTNGTYTFSLNSFSDIGANDPSEGIYASLGGTSVGTITVSDNTFTSDDNSVGSFDDAVDLFTYGTAQIMATVQDNIFTEVGGNAISLRTVQSGTLTASVSGNQITRPNDRGIFAEAQGGNVTITASSNRVSNAGSHGIEMFVHGGVLGKAALRDNTLLDNSLSILVGGEDGSTSCADITGNRVNTNMRFDGAMTGIINVERLDQSTGGPLTAVNTFDSGSVSLGTGNINPVNPGFCGIP